MNILNSAQLRNNLSTILDNVVLKQEPVLVGRFGQPKAVLVDYITYNWQKQVLDYVKRISKLTPGEIETLEILLDDKTRTALFRGLREAEEGKVIPLDQL